MNYILSLQLNFLFARECFDIFFYVRNVRFYENAGYNGIDKTAFVQWIE